MFAFVNMADVRLLRAVGPPYSEREPQPTPSSLPAVLPAYIDCALEYIIGFQPMPKPLPIMPGMPIAGIAGIPPPMPMPMLPIPPNALTLEPRSHSSFAAAIACCATAIWYACFATIIACWCAARNRGSAFGGGIMNGDGLIIGADGDGAQFIGDGGVKFIIGLAMFIRGPRLFSGISSSSSSCSEICPLTTLPSYAITCQSPNSNTAEHITHLDRRLSLAAPPLPPALFVVLGGLDTGPPALLRLVLKRDTRAAAMPRLRIRKCLPAVVAHTKVAAVRRRKRRAPAA